LVSVATAALGASIGAGLLGGSAAGIANLVLHKDQFTLRQKIAVLQETGVMRNAETVRAAVSHSGARAIALAECLLSTAGDAREIAENELAQRMELPAVRTGNGGVRNLVCRGRLKDLS
jgi:hypothetical protein